MRSLYRTVVVKRELSWKAKLSIYRSIYVPTLIYGHELWVMTERTRSRIQAAEMSILRRVAGLTLRDRVRSSVIREELRVEPLLLHIERSQLRWLGHLVRMPPGRLPGEVFRACPAGRRPRGRPRRDYVSQLAWERLGVLTVELEEVVRDREVWASLLRLLPPRPGPGVQRKDNVDNRMSQAKPPPAECTQMTVSLQWTSFIEHLVDFKRSHRQPPARADWSTIARPPAYYTISKCIKLPGRERKGALFQLRCSKTRLLVGIQGLL
ncbi:uncharacterized protein LOC129194983 [Dunckerocampus dactyliophorus]|uniref:uncharacterized protein LOC129194983 n=1 Tax=Dunckerocampus dactyliophorus TaxID=161453 RepID=UPI0024049A27|nr:uncharacterized protein LOC129194983 [Dunckerocampus dactyliophorus]XP_054656607.1 uncharacterized protein LOC129194983 [Dunckerocampus dactyliophorus]